MKEIACSGHIVAFVDVSMYCVVPLMVNVTLALSLAARMVKVRSWSARSHSEGDTKMVPFVAMNVTDVKLTSTKP